MDARLTIALCWWVGWRALYQVEHVNAIARMLREYIKLPFRLVLLTDQDATGAEVDSVGQVPSDPEGLKLLTTVNCFRRLRFFDPNYAKQFGTEYLMSIDIDTLIRADITDLIESAMQHRLTIIRGRWAGRSAKERPYNGAAYMIKVGENAQVWDKFDPVETPKEIKRIRWVGSDQCVIGMYAPGANTWGPEHGMYFFGQWRKDKRRINKDPGFAPARIINFAGREKPWMKPCKFQAPELHAEYLRWL